MESSRVLCKQGGTGSIPVRSTIFFLIARDLEKSPQSERSVIRAHCARTVQECVIGAPLCTMERPKKHRPPPPVPCERYEPDLSDKASSYVENGPG